MHLSLELVLASLRWPHKASAVGCPLAKCVGLSQIMVTVYVSVGGEGLRDGLPLLYTDTGAFAVFVQGSLFLSMEVRFFLSRLVRVCRF